MGKKNKKNKKIRKSNLQMIDTKEVKNLYRRYANLEKKAVDEYKLTASRNMANRVFEELFTFRDVSEILKEETGIDFTKAKEDFIQWLRDKAKEDKKFNEHLFVYTMDEVQDGRKTI